MKIDRDAFLSAVGMARRRHLLVNTHSRLSLRRINIGLHVAEAIELTMTSAMLPE